MMRILLLSVLMYFLAGCSLIPERPIEGYQLAKMQHLPVLNHWYFEGRLALVNDKDSISPSINWRHQSEQDEIQLAGPLAQGKLIITVTDDLVIVDDGEKIKEFKGSIENFLIAQLGVETPVNSLKFWVLGIGDPALELVEQAEGFDQNGWRVRYREMQRVNSMLLPKKIHIEKDKTKIKLIVDQWDIS